MKVSDILDDKTVGKIYAGCDRNKITEGYIYTLSQKTLDEHVKSYVVYGNSLIIIIKNF